MEGYLRKEKLKAGVYNRQEEKEHFHQDIELIYIIGGTMNIVVGEEETQLKPEDILVVNANKKHSFLASEDILYMMISIEYELISDIFQSVDIIFWCDSTRDDSETYDELRSVIRQLLKHYLNTGGKTRDFGHIALCYQIMNLLSVHFLVRAADREQMNERDRFEDRLFQINNYIRANYSQPITLKDLSEKLYLSIGYLSRFFKKNYGMSFSDYLFNIRLYHAVDELLYTDAPITRIAYDNGFASAAVFNKTFKKAYNEAPSVFRKKAKAQEQKKAPDGNDAMIEARLEQFLFGEAANGAKEIPTGNIQAAHSVLESSAFTPFWNVMINGGSAEDLLRSEVQEHLILLKEALGFTYIRFWNIFSPAMLIDITREDGDYNFTRLDFVLDFLIQHELKPHIELGQKPKRIHKSVQSLVYFEDNMVLFESLKQWDGVMNSLMRHLVHRYGHMEVDSWRMELWQDERKNREEAEHASSDYYALFNHTYETVRKYSRMKIGGCGIRMGFANDMNHAFLEEWMKQRCRPDYLSMICYAYERGEINLDRYSKRSTDPAFLMHQVLSVQKMMAQAGILSMELYVTEWNITVSDRNYINDSCYKGAYIIKNVLDAYGKANELDYFLGSDRVSEYSDSNRLMRGGTGLLTKDSILKPAGFAFDFLNRLYPYYIGQGEHYLITTDRHQTYGIICHNAKELNYNYYFTKEDEIEKEHLWKYFEDRDTLSLHLTLTDVEEGVYQMKLYRINEQSGSALDIWGEMNYEEELSRDDVKYFRRICEPKLSIQKYEAADGVLELDICMQANEIAYIRISKLV